MAERARVMAGRGAAARAAVADRAARRGAGSDVALAVLAAAISLTALVDLGSLLVQLVHS